MGFFPMSFPRVFYLFMSFASPNLFLNTISNLLD